LITVVAVAAAELTDVVLLLLEEVLELEVDYNLHLEQLDQHL
jgi:hypothetical protein